MEQIVAFPYDGINKKILLKTVRQQKYIIQDILSPKGWGYAGTHVLLNKKDIVVKNEIKNISHKCNAIWFMNSYYDLDFEKDIVPILRFCKTEGWIVYWGRSCTKKEKREIRSIILESKLVILQQIEERLDDSNRLYFLNTPIIFSVDFFGKMISWETGYNLSSALEQLGYSVSLLSRTYDIKMLRECDVFPESIMDINMHDRDKVIMLNHFLKMIEKKNKPDIIIVEVPGNIMEISRSVCGDFGCFPYILSKAVEPDVVIGNMPYAENITYNYKNLGEIAEKTIGINIDFYNIISSYLDLEESEQRNEFDYVSLSDAFVKKKMIHESGIYVAAEETDVKLLAKRIIETLLAYAEPNII